MNIHKQLKRLRLLTGMTQKELAKKAQCTQKQVSLIEGGQDCYTSTMRSMLKVLGYDLAAVPVEKEEGGQNADRSQSM